MDLIWAQKQLAQNADRIKIMVDAVTDDEARRKPDADSWSILEVVCHLLDEERYDFRVRLNHILAGSEGAFPPIHPGDWVTSHRYNEQDLAASLADFLAERQTSLAWLETLAEPDWAATNPVPWGVISAGEMLAAWVAHDLLHLRQLVELHWFRTTTHLAPYRPDYAGEW
ncbi:MAG: DinB family protein [Caldilineaceae bacterium]|nr:DinB family protein [Caldilineaceae bacterium]MBP8109273.1 DinB family protein [Caldilineaceae bacterium]MBP8123896.1 DinB family protein [Caldilineaceae bacterium]MBP9071825.1 DinB family protein [Caldilineaceae bacterium]